jgi:hypothetical protein
VEIQAATPSSPEALPDDAAGAGAEEEAGRLGWGVEGRLDVRACSYKQLG